MFFSLFFMSNHINVKLYIISQRHLMFYFKCIDCFPSSTRPNIGQQLQVCSGDCSFPMLERRFFSGKLYLRQASHGLISLFWTPFLRPSFSFSDVPNIYFYSSGLLQFHQEFLQIHSIQHIWRCACKTCIVYEVGGN